MRIGILTTHDSTNYGAQLQTYAMQQIFRNMGYDACVLDLRRNPKGEMLKRYVYEPFVCRLLRLVSFAGGWIDAFRRYNARSFLKRSLHLTPYHFTRWRDAPADLGVDVVVVGSDQVWNSAINNVEDYMPNQYVSPTVPWISYAASIGRADIPEKEIDVFRNKASLFSAISVRECSAAKIFEGLGINAKHVVDPVVLAGKDCWRQLVATNVFFENKVCVYSLGIGDTLDIARQVSQFAKRKGFEVDIFTGGLEFLPLPSQSNLLGLFRNIRHWMRFAFIPKINLRLCSGPIGFLSSLMTSKIVITNSYHALVFAAMFGKEVRYIVPSNKIQSDAMVRIMDYAGKIIYGPVLQPSLDAALKSLLKDEHIHIKEEGLERMRTDSLTWVQKVIEEYI